MFFMLKTCGIVGSGKYATSPSNSKMVTITDQPGQQQETEEFLRRWKGKEDEIQLDISRLARCACARTVCQSNSVRDYHFPHRTR